MSRCAAGSNWMNHGTFGELLCHLTTGTRQRDWRPDTDPSFPKYPRLPIIAQFMSRSLRTMRQIAELIAVLACGLFTGAAVYVTPWDGVRIHAQLVELRSGREFAWEQSRQCSWAI